MEEHITYDLVDTSESIELDLSNFLSDFETLDVKDDRIFVDIKNYDLNYNLKQLLLICDYYGISKGIIKINKMKKSDVIEQIVLFEQDENNSETVEKRKELWYYINELKNDKFMKKFILW